MPGISAEYDPNNRDVNAAGDTERVNRQKYIDERWKYYDGDHFRWLKKDPGAVRDDNITLNLCGRATDKAVEFINVPESFDLPSSDDSAETKSTSEATLDGLFDHYRREIPEITLSNLISGHSFLKLHYDDDNNPAMTMLDPRYVTVFWDMMNAKRVLFYRLQWKNGNNAYRQDIVPDWLMESKTDAIDKVQVASSWAIIDYVQRQGSSEWKATGQQQIWEYEFAPIVDWPYKKRPHQYYGVSFLHNSVPLNDAVNFTASNIGRILRHHAHPKTFAFGFQVSDDNAVGGIWDDLPETGRVETLELMSDLASSMNFLSSLRQEFFSNQRILDQSNIKDQVGQLTNFGVRMLYADQMGMTDEARTMIGDGLSETFRRLMVMSNSADETPVPKWADPLPTNRSELVQTAAVESKLGTTSKETLAESIGRDYEAEKDKMMSEGALASDQLALTLNQLGQRTGGGFQNAFNGNTRVPAAF